MKDRAFWRRAWPLAAALVALAGPAAAETTPLRLCADPDDLPFSSASAQTPGFYIELGRDVAREMGRPFEPVWVPTFYAKRQIRQKLLTGQCDGFIGVPDEASFMGPRLIFSRPIVTLGYALVTPAATTIEGIDALRGHRVAVQFSTPPQDLLTIRSDVQTVTALSAEEAMQDMAAGKADAAFIWGPSAGWVNQSVMHGAYRVTPAQGDHLQWSAAIAFPAGRTDLRDSVDRALNSMGGSIGALAAKYGFPGVGPPVVPVATSDRAASPPDAAEIDAGRKLFNENCSHCHGPDAVQGEQRRNLRLLHVRYGDEMAAKFTATVTHGRVSKGMPNWSGILSEDDFAKILAFLSSVQEPGP